MILDEEIVESIMDPLMKLVEKVPVLEENEIVSAMVMMRILNKESALL